MAIRPPATVTGYVGALVDGRGLAKVATDIAARNGVSVAHTVDRGNFLTRRLMQIHSFSFSPDSNAARTAADQFRGAWESIRLPLRAR